MCFVNLVQISGLIHLVEVTEASISETHLSISQTNPLKAF